MAARTQRLHWMLSDALEGLFWGALLSVLPLELAMLLVALLGLVTVYRIATRERTGDRLGLLVMAAFAFWVLAIARALPLKYADRPLSPLTSQQLPLSVLLKELRAQGIASEVSEGPELERVITLPSRQPTPRQLREVLRAQAGLDLDIGYCGTNATILWGSHPMVPVIRAPEPGDALSRSGERSGQTD